MGSPPDASAVEAQLARILASNGLRRSRRRCELLQWSVERVLQGDAEPVKEHRIGLEVFGKPESWDPRVDPIVRVEFNRLRRKLREYYEGEGGQDPLVIEFPARGYLPVFMERTASLLRQKADDRADHEAGPPDWPAGETARETRFGRRIWAPVAATLLLAASALSLWLWSTPQPPVSSLAVLPFLDLSPNHQDEYLSDGFTDELTNSLAALHGLRVVSRTSAFQFKGKGADVRAIGRSLSVGSVVEGSILRGGNAFRVTAQLNRTSDGMHLWTAHYDRETTDILKVQSEIAERIAAALQIRLGTGPSPAQAIEPGEAALDQYLHGVYEHEQLTPASLEKAAGYYEAAIRLEPRYAAAYGGLTSVALTRSVFAGWRQKAEWEKVREYGRHALDLNPNLGAVQAYVAQADYVLDWDWPRAEGEFQQALRLAPGNSTHGLYGIALMTRGRFAEAEHQCRQALGLSPLNVADHINFAIVLTGAGKYEDADEQLRFCLERNPKLFVARLYRAYLALYTKRPQDALEQLRQAAAIVPGHPLLDATEAAAYAEAGRRQEALALMERMERQASEVPYFRYHLAIVKALLGDGAGVCYWLERSVDAHETQALYTRVDPLLAGYQSDPRIQALERRMRLIP